MAEDITPEEVTPEEIAPVETPEVQPEVVDFSTFGDDFKDAKSYEDVAHRLHSNYQYEKRLREEREQTYQRELHQTRSDPSYQDYLRSKQEQANKKPEEPVFWDAPMPDLAVLQKYTIKDPEGRATFAPDTPHEIRAQFDKWKSAREAFDARMASNPYEVYKPYIEHIATQVASKLTGESLSQREEQWFLQQYEQANKDWLFEKDVDPVTGRQQPTQMGTYFLNLLQQGKQLGITSQRALILDAHAKIAPYLERVNAPDIQETDAQKKLAYQKQKAKQTADRGGSFPKPGAKPGSQNPKQSLADKLRAKFDAEGITDELLANSR
jgi:hypothetical protein